MGTVRSALLCPLAFLAASCAKQAPPAETPKPLETRSTAPAASVPHLPEGPFFVLAPRRNQRATTLSVHLYQGQRFETKNGQLSRGETGTEPALLGYFEVPETHGGGFLFYNDRQLFRAGTFTGELSPFADVGSRPQGLSIGPGFFLVLTASGRVVVDAATGERRGLPLPGLVDVVIDANGRGLALDQMKRAFALLDGKAWKSVDAMLASPATDVSDLEGQAYFRLETGDVAVLSEQGQFLTLPRLSSSTTDRDPRWTDSDAPLTRAARAGVRLPDARGAVPTGSSIATIDLLSGELLDVSPIIVAGARECQFLEAEGEPLLACKAENVTIVRTPLSNPTLEKTFPSETRLTYALGRLAIEGKCDGTIEWGRVCVRSEDGKYQDFDQRQKLAELGKEKDLGEDYAFSVQWIPSGESALGVISSPVSALIDAKSGSITVLPEDSSSSFYDVTRTPYREIVSTTRLALPAEGIALRGFSSTGSFAVAADGTVLPSAHQLTRVVGSGSRAIGLDTSNKMFESLDFGTSWHEVEAPPGDVRVTECSPLGCAGNDWLRIGWGERSAAPKEDLRIVPLEPVRPRAALPTLVCRDSGPPRVKRASPWVDTQTVTRDLGFGAQNVILQGGNDAFFRMLGGWSSESSYLGLVAMVYGRQPQFREGPNGLVLTQAELLRPKTVFYSSWFEPSARVRTARITWQGQLQAAERLGGARPSFSVYDHAELRVLPVAAAESPDAGLLLQEETSLTWIAKNGRPMDLSLGADIGVDPIAAVSRGDQVFLLVHTGNSPSAVMSLGSDRLSVVQSPKGMPRVLAIRADGTLAAGYLPVGPEPPSQRDPMQLVPTAAGPLVLAEWSTLEPANAPECAPAPDDYRFTLRLDSPWLELELPRVERPYGSSSDQRTLALVRANAQRFCLEAVEITGLTHTTEADTFPLRAVATFTGENEASLIGISPGSEYRQDLDCAIESR